MKKKEKKEKKPLTASDFLLRAVMVICLIIFLGCAVYLGALAWESYSNRRASQAVYEQYVTVADGSSELNSGTYSLPSVEDSGEELQNPLFPVPALSIDFQSLWGVNEYVTAWIQVSGIDAISYPVVWNNDVTYYLTHSWDGQDSRYGAIFMDSMNNPDFTDCYTLIYGHNMKDGTMFGGLKKYREQSFYEENGGYIFLYLPERTRVYQIFSVRQVADNDATTYTLGFAHDATFASYLEKMKAGSMYDTGVDVSANDSVITLSTCSGDDRLVLHAKLVATY